MKKLVAVLLLLLMLATGCSPSGEKTALDPKNPVTVTLWHYYVGENQRALDTAVATFNQTVGIEKGVIVDAVAMGSIADLEENITKSAQGAINALPMPQIFSSYADKAMEIDSFGAIVDLNEYFTAEEKALYIEGFLSDGILGEGRLLVLPIVKSTELMYVNATDWNAFAAATGRTEADLVTWESVLSTAREYYQWTDAQTPGAGWDGTSLIGVDSVANFIIIGNKQLGVDIIDSASGQKGAAVIDKAAMGRLFENYFTGMALGYYGAYGKFRSDDIKAGSMIAYVGSSSSAAYFPTWIEKNGEKSPIDFMPLQYPVFEGGDAGAIQQGAGMCIAKSTPAQQEGSALFLKWFTGTQQNISFAMTTGYLPVQRDSYSSPEFEAALSGLRGGDQAAQNVAGVYQIALRQITEANTYAAKPFTGSYSVRSALQAALVAAVDRGIEDAAPLKARGMSEAEILAALNVEARYTAFVEDVSKALADKGIECIIK